MSKDEQPTRTDRGGFVPIGELALALTDGGRRQA